MVAARQFFNNAVKSLTEIAGNIGLKSPSAFQVTGLLFITIAAFFAGSLLQVFSSISYSLYGIENLVEALEEGGVRIDDYAAQFGVAVATYHVMLFMTCFVIFVCWKSKASHGAKAAFAVPMGITIFATFVVVVMERATANAGGWYDDGLGFYYDMGSPVIYFAGFFLLLRHFWHMTSQKPTADDND